MSVEAEESLFLLVCDLARALGVHDINKLPGCWEHRVDEQWSIAVNAHLKTMKGLGVAVPPGNVYVEFNGWPAGFFTVYEGCLAAGTVANEETFAAALKKAVAAAEAEGKEKP